MDMHIGGLPYEDRSYAALRQERPGTDPALPPSEEARLCGHLDLRMLASRTVRQETSAVQGSQFVVHCHNSPRKPI